METTNPTSLQTAKTTLAGRRLHFELSQDSPRLALRAKRQAFLPATIRPQRITAVSANLALQSVLAHITIWDSRAESHSHTTADGKEEDGSVGTGEDAKKATKRGVHGANGANAHLEPIPSTEYA